MKLKTAALTGPALDWAVAKCEDMLDDADPSAIQIAGHYWDDEGLQWAIDYCPSTDWSQGGPIIEKEGIDLCSCHEEWEANYCDLRFRADTPLIAAMRCYVASKLGDQVEVPDELC